MTTPPTRTVGKLKQAISRRLPRRRDDSGLTTLEWLLIVAAVAGLAALAVVLVQNVVGDTSEQIAGSSARRTAAKIAATAIMEDARRNGADQPRDAQTYDKWIDHYTRKCRRLAITYGDAGITVQSNFVHKTGAGTGQKVEDTVVANNVNLGNAEKPLKADGTIDTSAMPDATTGIFTPTVPTTLGDAHAECIIL